MFVGDAAVADPMTGEGIGQAILTGRLAAEALLADDEPSGSTETTFGANHRRHRMARSSSRSCR